jgi:hypothetical protein
MFCGTMLKNVDNVPATDIPQVVRTHRHHSSAGKFVAEYSPISLSEYKHRTKVRKRSRLHVRSEYVVVDCVSWKWIKF